MGSSGPCLVHRPVDGVIGGKDRNHCPEEKTQPFFQNGNCFRQSNTREYCEEDRQGLHQRLQGRKEHQGY